MLSLRILTFIFLFPLVVFSQNSRGNDCRKISIDALKLLPEFYRSGKRAQVDSVLKDWIYYCGKNEYSMRLSTLLRIADENFAPFDFDQAQYDALLGYIGDVKFQALMDSVHENPRELYLSYFGEPDLVFSYNEFTRTLAAELSTRGSSTSRCSTERMILDAYAHDFPGFFSALKDTSCLETPAHFYRAQIKAIERKLLVNTGLYTGWWFPYGNNKVLGSHPLFGLYFGVGRKRMTYDMTFEFRFGKSKDAYIVQYQGAPVVTKHFLGGYIGLHAGYEAFRLKDSRFYILGGVGFDGFDAIESSEEKKGKSIGALNLNTGLAWRKFSRDGTYIGLEGRHNFVRYNNEGGTNVDGNTITTKLVLGILKNDRRRRELEYFRKLTN